MKTLNVGLTLGLALAALVTGAQAKDYKTEGTFSWVAKGEAMQVGDGRFFWVGSYNGVNLLMDDTNPLQNSAVVCPGWQDVGVASAGFCQVIVDKDNIAYVQWSSDGKIPATGKLTYTGGTGKFAKATGSGEFTAVFATSANPDGTQSGVTTYHNVTMTLPD